MKTLIPKNEYGLFADRNGTVRVDSLFVASAFGKSHDHVIRDIRKLLSPESGLSREFNLANFGEIAYRDGRNRKQTAYALTFDGFAILVMGYTGKTALQFKETYIRQFNEMRATIAALLNARREFPSLTASIRMVHEHPRPYHFSNECDLLNRLVIGKTAKEYRLENGIANGESIRPYLNERQIRELDYLQTLDTGLIVGVPDFQQRKRILASCLKQYRDERK